MATILLKRGTRAQLEAAAAAGQLAAGEPYLLTDEARVAIGTGSGTSQDLAKRGESPRVVQVVSTASIAPVADSTDMYIVTALAEAATIGTPSGTPAQGQKLVMRIKDNGTARALSWASGYRAIGVTLPGTTTAGKTLYAGFMYDATDSRWDVLAMAKEA